MKLIVEFKYEQNVIIHHTSEDAPVYGDRITFIVNEQKIIQTLSISSIEPLGKNDRVSARLLGQHISMLGNDITKQALYGNSRKIVHEDGDVETYF